MVETVCDFWRERACAVCRFGRDGTNFRVDKIAERGRQDSFTAKSDFRSRLSSARFADERIALVCDFLYFVLAVFDVAALPEANFYQSLIPTQIAGS